MNRKRLLGISFVLALMALGVAACYPMYLPPATPSEAPAAADLQPTLTTEAILPTVAASATLAPTLTATPSATPRPVATAVPTATPQPATTEPTATEIPATETPAGPTKVVVTDADMQSAISSGALGANGVDAVNVQVHFTDGKVKLSADRVSYGLIGVSNLAVIGRLVAENGVLQVQVESITPGGLVASMLPGVINKALAQFGSQWYVEDVTISEGQLELTVR